ncbi:SusD/RagB family nutrient-binding outer membrane lipoprotein [Fodinibius sediminis]|uniref:Starch-binding associating with outer membrane n=1 Tax=Fodinibius sediminis TaxID=1214077 RepID=A0A521DHR2_9BACT|nr:SusD/RagB family nutrient-binding outer membrane lipoprotein [Fodinibius sediminis]SMO71304.1 Starch-binding associating with outer membrane [Fodinibius sediminis]
MKRDIYNSLSVALLTIIAVVSCTDHFEELNEPPTSVTEIDPALVFSSTQRDMMYDSSNDYWKTNTMQYGAWVQHWGISDRNQTAPFYIPMLAWHDNDWEWHYNQLKELSQAEKLLLGSVEGSNPDDPAIRSKMAMVKFLHVYVAERLTALVGDMPYFEAVQGISGISTPVYDAQQDIYPALLDTLDKYIGKLNNGDQSFGEADFFYGGDIDLWRKFGNSLKLRIGMRLKYIDPAAAEEAVTDAMGGPLLASNAESATVPTTSGGGSDFQAHPILAIFRQPVGKSQVGETIIETLKAKDDPRLTLIAEPTANSKNDPPLEYRGIPHGMTNAEADQVDVGDYSYPSSSIFVNEALARPMKVFMYPEVAFLKAEAALEGWGAAPAAAEEYYQDGIQADLSRFPYNVSQGDIEAYLANEGSLSGTHADQMEQIMTQKWLAFFDQSMQAYIEWRRTSYPRLDPGSAQGVTNGNIPRRGLYHRDEASLNPTNYQEAIQRQGPDEVMTKVWIDANPSNGQQ